VNKIRIAAFACSNGLGHLRRIVAISAFMLKNGFHGKIDLYASTYHIKILQGWSEMDYVIFSNNVQIIDYVYPLHSNAASTRLFDKDWIGVKLPNLSKYDIIWSDNIVNVLEKRPDSILTGSFFWHEVLKVSSENTELSSYLADQKSLVKSVKPLMVGNEYFTTPDVRLNTNFFPVGLYRYSLSFEEKTNKGILLSCGLGGEEEDEVRDAVLRIIKDDIMPPEVLFVDPRLLPDKYPKWIQKASFNSAMFLNCIAVCIRPGMGTICDALIARSRIFAFSNESSSEMIHNCNVLEKMNLGKRCKDPLSSYLEALKFATKDKEIDEQIFRTSHLRADGVFATANLIINRELMK